jgi:hypothetical protein
VCARAQAPVVVLGANCMGLLPVSGSDPMQFGNRPLRAGRARPDRR